MTLSPTACASRWLKNGAIALLVAAAVISWGTQGAMATSSPSVGQLLEAIAALEARVAALEEKQQRTETVAGQQTQEASMPRPLLVSLADGNVQPSPMMVAPAAQPIALQEENGWSGLYWGTSFGYGSAFSQSKYRNDSTNQSQYTPTSSSSGSSGTNFQTGTSSYAYLYNYTSQTNASSDGTDRREGALADLYLGVNGHLTPRIIVGAQVEGTLSEMTFGSTTNRHNTTSTQTNTNSQTSSFSSTSSGYTDQSSGTSSSTGSSTNIYPDPTELELDWMVSIIGRAGVLATPTTYLYGLAGWSYGHFDVEQIPYDFGLNKIQDFYASGPTVGGGIEKKLSPKWSLRAEYRYTNFGSTRLSARDQTSYSSSSSGPSQSSSSNTSSSVCCGSSSGSSSGSSTGTNSNSSTGTNRSTGSIDNDMHVGRIGITRYFNLGN